MHMAPVFWLVWVFAPVRVLTNVLFRHDNPVVEISPFVIVFVIILLMTTFVGFSLLVYIIFTVCSFEQNKSHVLLEPTLGLPEDWCVS